MVYPVAFIFLVVLACVGSFSALALASYFFHRQREKNFMEGVKQLQEDYRRMLE